MESELLRSKRRDEKFIPLKRSDSGKSLPLRVNAMNEEAKIEKNLYFLYIIDLLIIFSVQFRLCG